MWKVDRLQLFLPCVLLLLLVPVPSWAQIKPREAPGSEGRYGEPVVSRFRVGAEITAARGACRHVRAMVAVPLECDEQQVKVVAEDFNRHVAKVDFRDLGGARQMLIYVPTLPAGATARAVVTYELQTRPTLPPDDEQTTSLRIPEHVDRSLRQYLQPSPFIESRHPSLRDAAREVWQEAGTASSDWQKVEALYDHMLQTIRYSEGPDKSAVDTMRDGHADCHGRSAYFIALCRASGIPARVVWVNHHCYPEFYLVDASGEGRWYPAESAGSRAFGEMPLARAVLQRGDNFRVPERSERLRYASDYVVGVPAPGSGQPKVRYIREQIEAQ